MFNFKLLPSLRPLSLCSCICVYFPFAQKQEEGIKDLLESQESANERATAKPIFPSETGVKAGGGDSNEATSVVTPEGNQALPSSCSSSVHQALTDREEELGEGSSTEAFRSTVKEDEGCSGGSLGVPVGVTGEASSRLSDVRKEVAMRSSLPVNELYESIRDPVDEASFDERKRGISSSVKKVSPLSLP